MVRPLVVYAAAVLSLSIGAASPSEAGVIQLTSPSDLSAGATTAALTGATGTFVSEPYVISAGGNTLTYTEAFGDQFFLTDQAFFGGNFDPGTALLMTADAGIQGDFGPVTISFATGVTEIGMGAQAGFINFNTFTITAFNGSTSLGSFNVAGDSFVSFLGVRATEGDVITSLTIENSPENFFVLAAPTFVTPVAVPEPATLTMLLSSGLAVLVRRRYARRGRTTCISAGAGPLTGPLPD